MKFNSLPHPLNHFKEQKTCIAFLKKQRWNGQPVSPYCGSKKTYKTTRDHQCADKKCHKKFTVTVATLFESSKIKLSNWFAAIYLATAHKKGISSLQLHRNLGVTQKSAWFILHRIREMLQDKGSLILRGQTEVDETFVGGKNKNRHADKKVKESQGRSVKDKRPLFQLVNKGMVKTQVVADRKAKALKPIIEKIVEKRSTIVSDDMYKIVSLFTGCGGLDLGFRGGFTSLGRFYEKRRFEHIWCNDVDKNACLTFERNFSEPIVCGDITEILNGNYPQSAPGLPNSADVVLGGFPCQDFSLAGKRKAFKTRRGKLYLSMVEMVKRMRPAIFIAENVKGLLSIDGAIQTIFSDFAELGYDVNYKLYNAADFGVPQNRQRVIIVGTDNERFLPEFEFPEPPLSNEEWLSIGEAIGDLENINEGEAQNHFWSKAKRFPGTQGNTTVTIDKVAPTMRAEHHGNIEFHWNDSRRLSAREAARIQSFPDDFIFYPSTSSAYKQIGNAVPPILGWYLASSIERYLQKHFRP